MVLYSTDDWNISEILKLKNWQDIIINRTNNGLERSNRQLNESFVTTKSTSFFG